jgi:D-glutamate cyclase-like, C-terminal
VDVVASIERVVARDVGRGSEALSRHTAGSLRRAATSLLAASDLDVAILTGFYVPGAQPPAAETDGPVGAVQLAAAVLALGGRARIVTDSPCGPVLRAAIGAAGVEQALNVVPAGGGLSPSTLWDGQNVTHLVAIERVGPSWGGGPPRNMRGDDISAWTAPLEQLFQPGAGTRIAIGDGGNELGMGVLPHDMVAAVVANGALIHCPVDCDALVVAGTSNWGAAGLVAALAALRPEVGPLLAPLLVPSWSRGVLEAIVHDAGAVDGVLRAAVPSVDGLDWAAYADVLAEVAAAVNT